jgi:3-oxoacyl-[acyl-carrier-protein] synthase-3
MRIIGPAPRDCFALYEMNGFMPRAAMTGWGSCLPEKILTNADLEKLVDTSDEWIRSRTGIRERRLAAPSESSASLGLAAARRALDCAQLPAADLDLVIFTATAADYLLPASSCLIQQQLGATRAAAFDLNTACSGFVYSLTTAAQFIQSGMYRRILVVAGETLTRFVNWKDRGTCILFGDGGAAAVLEATDQDAGLLSSVLGSRGDVEKNLVIEAGAAAMPATEATLAAGNHFLKMRGNEVFKLAVRNMTHSAREAIEKAGLTLGDLRAVIPHQANSRILIATQEALAIPLEKFHINVDRFGNTGAASIGIAWTEYLEQKSAQAGDVFALLAFGGGFTWGASIYRWPDVEAIRSRRSN